MQVQSLSQEDSLKWEVAIHSSILACKILWTEEPGRVQSMASQRVIRDSASTQTHTTDTLDMGLLMAS